MTDNYTNIILEEILSQNKVIMEAVGDMQSQVAKLPAIQADIAELKADMKVVKAAVVDTSNELHKLEQRVTHLEAAP